MDRTHQSKVTARLLTDLGVQVEVHKRHYLPEAPDPEWIADAAQRGWIIISGDKGIELDGVNRQAVASSKAKIFLLADTESRGAEWAAALVTARHRVFQIAADNNGPFYCNIEKGSAQHVRTPRFLEGGGPRPKGEGHSTTEVAVTELKAVDAAPEPLASQDQFDFGHEG